MSRATAGQTKSAALHADITATYGGCWTYHGPLDPEDVARKVHALLRGPLCADTTLNVRCSNARCVRPGPGHRERNDWLSAS
jgi:hypothetical protein